METERPLDALNMARGKRVLVELKNKKRISGILKAFDIHINLVLEQAEERDENGEMARNLGNVFLRGDMIVLVSPSE
ncbi:MAG: LSM domain-containing protein [Nanoarchaeota archaeon]